MVIQMSKAKYEAAIIQTAPVLFNKPETTEKVIKLIAEASSHGAKVLLFPESLIPAYPRGLSFGTVIGSRSEEGREAWQVYWENSVELNGPEIELICKSAKENNVFVSLGITERDTITSGGTLYCTQVYISNGGEILGIHRKTKPTGTERLIWGEGDASTLTVVNTPYGKIGGLICWENYMPLARMAMYEQGVEIYMAPTADARDTWQSTLQHIACEGRCYVLGCNQFVRKEMYPQNLPGIEDLDKQPDIMCRGGSVVIGPMGNVIAGPLWDREGILYAEIDISLISKSKLDFDVVGHYSRPDLFHFEVKK